MFLYSKIKESSGRVSLQLEYQNRVYNSRAVDTDIIKASAMAYLANVLLELLTLLEQLNRHKS